MDVFPEFLASLPATGWDGTLKKRIGKGDARGPQGPLACQERYAHRADQRLRLGRLLPSPEARPHRVLHPRKRHEGRTQPAIADLRDQQDQVLVAFMNEI